MNRKQWFVLGFGFMLLSSIFMGMDDGFETICGTPNTLDINEGFEPLQRYELWCINTEIFDPFIYVLWGLSIMCYICGFIEPKREK